MKHEFLRKIALAVILALLVTCFASCKSAGGDDEGSAVVDEYVEGVQQESSGDTPTIVPNDKNNPSSGEGNDTPANNDQTNNDQTNNDQTNDDQTNNDQTNNDQTNDDQTNDDQTNDDQTGGEDGEDDENEVQKPAYDESKKLTIVSYNIKCAWYSKTFDQIVEQIKAADADIVGFQEVDLFTSRSKNVDQIATIAAKAGFEYFYFEPVIEYGKPGEKAPEDIKANSYGHAVMSKYPITKSEIIWPDDQTDDGEVRNFGRHEIDVDGTTIVFYNTHLDFQKGRFQYFEVQEEYMAKDEYAICVGDFNETYDEYNVYFDSDKFYNFTFGEDNNNVLLRTNAETGKKSQYIDHIIVTKDKFTWQDGGEGNGLFMTPHEGASDHNMIYCNLNIIK